MREGDTEIERRWGEISYAVISNTAITKRLDCAADVTF
jgi:hypothetical protein